MTMKSCSYPIYIHYIIHNVQCQELREVLPPSEKDRKAREKLQEKVSDFQVTFDNNVYLS